MVLPACLPACLPCLPARCQPACLQGAVAVAALLACNPAQRILVALVAPHPLQADAVRLCEDENDTQARPEKFLYVLMYVCLFTRRVWLRALRSKSAIGVAREVSTRFDCPRVMQCRAWRLTECADTARLALALLS